MKAVVIVVFLGLALLGSWLWFYGYSIGPAQSDCRDTGGVPELEHFVSVNCRYQPAEGGP